MSHHRHHQDQPSDESGTNQVGDLDDNDFDALEDEVDRLAAQPQSEPAAPVQHTRQGSLRTEDDFKAVVQEALDALPEEFGRAVQHVVIVVSDDGAKVQAYGQYIGRGAGNEFEIGRPDGYIVPDEIVIYRDTLTRDFGKNPPLLRQQITRTVRHEVGHHLGLDEDGIRRLGL
jgi:predicted Zn-dependent protease with MMP-like domain